MIKELPWPGPKPSTPGQQVTEPLWQHTMKNWALLAWEGSYFDLLLYLFSSKIHCRVRYVVCRLLPGGVPHFTVHLYGSQVRKKGPKEILLISYEGRGKTSGTSWLLGNGSWGSGGQKISRARDTQSVTWFSSLPTLWLGRAEMP